MESVSLILLYWRRITAPIAHAVGFQHFFHMCSAMVAILPVSHQTTSYEQASAFQEFLCRRRTADALITLHPVFLHQRRPDDLALPDIDPQRAVLLRRHRGT